MGADSPVPWPFWDSDFKFLDLSFAVCDTEVTLSPLFPHETGSEAHATHAWETRVA